MATIPEITDRLETATEKAENASQIIYDVANGDASTEVPTASGPTPTLKKWFQNLGSSVEPMLAGIPARLDKAVLIYQTKTDADAAALPDGQQVLVIDTQTVYEVSAGSLSAKYSYVLSFVDRSDFVSSGHVASDGSIVSVEGLQYIRSAGSLMIPDLPGWEPLGDKTPEHFGANSGVNNATAFARWAASARDGDALRVIAQSYEIDVTDADIQIADQSNRNWTLGLIQGKKNIDIYGSSDIFIKTSGSSKRVFLICHKECDNITTRLNIRGDLVLKENVPNSEIGAAYGIYVLNSKRCVTTACRLEKLIIPYHDSGFGVSPSPVVVVNDANQFVGNHVEYFEQCTTFGAASANLLISDNTFKNFHTAFKLSLTPKDATANGLARNVTFSNNIAYYSSDFEFAQVWFEPTKSQVPNGLMIEGPWNNILVFGNDIDFRNARALTLPPVSASAPILVLTASDTPVSSDPNFQPKKLKITNNVCHAGLYVDREAIRCTTAYEDVQIEQNTCYGAIRVFGTGALAGYAYGSLSVTGNKTFTIANKPAQLSVTGRYKTAVINRNELYGNSSYQISGDETSLFISGLIADEITIDGNVLPKGRISDYGNGALQAPIVRLKNNDCRNMAFSITGASTLAIQGNTSVTNSVHFDITLDEATRDTVKVGFIGNTTTGETNEAGGLILRINGGRLRIDGNADWGGGAGYSLDPRCYVLSGHFKGNGEPTSIQAGTGVMYTNLSVASGQPVWLKTATSGATGWQKIQTTA